MEDNSRGEGQLLQDICSSAWMCISRNKEYNLSTSTSRSDHQHYGQDLVLKLRKKLYGLKDDERAWWEHLSSGLEQMGFKQCLADQCVWKRDGIIIIVYVDDCLFFGNDKEKVDAVVLDISKRFKITAEGETIEEYLEIRIDHN
eukprot:1038588-Ditylum_brightwellii.AAC.2